MLKAEAKENIVELRLGETVLMKTRWSGANPESLAKKQANEINAALGTIDSSSVEPDELPVLPEGVRLLAGLEDDDISLEELGSWAEAHGVELEILEDE